MGQWCAFSIGEVRPPSSDEGWGWKAGDVMYRLCQHSSQSWNTFSGPLCLMAYSNVPALFMYNRQPCLPACLPPWWCSRCTLHKACYGCWNSCVHEFSFLPFPIPSTLSFSPIPIVHGPVGSVQRMRSVEGKIHQESECRDIPPAFLSFPSPYVRQRLLWRVVKVGEFYVPGLPLNAIHWRRLSVPLLASRVN